MQLRSVRQLLPSTDLTAYWPHVPPQVDMLVVYPFEYDLKVA